MLPLPTIACHLLLALRAVTTPVTERAFGVSSQPAPHAAAIVVIVLPERDAQTRFLERDDDQVHRRPGQDDERERQNLAERQRRAEVYEGHADVHRVARPGMMRRWRQKARAARQD